MGKAGKYRIKACLAVLAVLLCACSLCGCWWQYKWVITDEFGIGYKKKVAFVGTCFWYGDKDKTTFVIPDEYKGRKITALGGYIGKGYPCLFHVSDEANKYDFSSHPAWDHETYDTVVFTIVLGKNIKQIEHAVGRQYLGVERENDDGTRIRDVVRKIVYAFEVHPDNKTFCAQDGRLYSQKDGTLVDGFFYE